MQLARAIDTEDESPEIPFVCGEPLACRIETDFSSITDLRSQWDEAAARLGAPIYMSFDWLQLWWKFYGRECGLRLFIFTSGGRIVALIPIYLETFGRGPFKTVVARLVGASVPPKSFNPPVAPEVADEVFWKVLRHLFIADKCDLLSFGPVAKCWSAGPAFQTCCDSAGTLLDSAEYRQRDVVTFFNLPPTFDAYIASLSSSERKNRRKRLRALESTFTITTDVVSEPDEVVAEFESFLEQHTAQWRSEGKSGHFDAWPHGREFHRAMVKQQAKQERLRFFRLLADGAVIVNRYAYLFGGVLYSELPSRVVGQEWDKLGIGSSSMVKFFESAISHSFFTIDSGLGSYEHKRQLGGGEVPVGTWRLIANRSSSRLKVRALLGLARLVSLLCHKIWYRRVSPRLSSSWARTQSMAWLRYDF